MWNERTHYMWLENMVKHNKREREVVSNCCCERLIPESQRCSGCKENCTPIYI